MTPAQRPAVLALAVALLSGCASGSPEGALREQVAAVTEAANARDAGLLRARAERLLATVDEQGADGRLAAPEAERLAGLARAVHRSADVIDADLLERQRRAAELEAEQARLDAERAQLEADRKQAEERARAEAERAEADKGKGKRDKDEDRDEDDDD